MWKAPRVSSGARRGLLLEAPDGSTVIGRADVDGDRRPEGLVFLNEFGL